jgi:lysyl-tRNA synthetase class 2
MDRLSLLAFRSSFLGAVRSFFLGAGYLEVDTPLRLPALIPEAEILPFASEDWWLQTSPELCMKRLLACGASQLFQICHCFRKGEQGRFHQPEFSMLEWYHVHWNYRHLMEEVEALLSELLRACAHFPAVQDGNSLVLQKREISFAGSFQRITVEEAFRQYAGMPVHRALAEDRFDEILVTEIEPHLGWDSPLFLVDYPAELASLARRRPDNPQVAERFELYIGGIEIANGFSELIDPKEQKHRFVREREKIEQQGRRAGPMPEEFLDDLALLRETAGIALGLDRLLMLFLGCASLGDVQAIQLENFTK